MFEVKVDRNEYKIEFTHFQGDIAKLGLGHEGTVCMIFDNIGLTVSYGETTLNSSDNYDKNFGRKLSLRRALRKAKFTRDQRIVFWDKYFETRGKVN